MKLGKKDKCKFVKCVTVSELYSHFHSCKRNIDLNDNLKHTQ